MVPWYPSDAPPEGEKYDFGLYVVIGDPEETIDLEVNSGTNGYRLTLAGPNSRMDIQSTAATGTDVLSINDLGAVQPSLALRSASGAPYRIAFHRQAMTPGFERETRAFVLPEFRPPSATAVEMGLETAATGGFSVRSPEVNLQYDLQIQRIVGEEVQSVTRENLQVPAGQRQLIQPRQWDALQNGALQIQKQPLVEPQRVDVNEQIDGNE